MGVVSDHEYLVSEHRHTSIRPERSIADQPGCSRPRIHPNLPAREGVESVGLIGTRDIHNAVSDKRRDLQAEVRDRRGPLQHQARYRGRIDLLELTVPIPSEL